MKRTTRALIGPGTYLLLALSWPAMAGVRVGIGDIQPVSLPGPVIQGPMPLAAGMMPDIIMPAALVLPVSHDPAALLLQPRQSSVEQSWSAAPLFDGVRPKGAPDIWLKHPTVSLWVPPAALGMRLSPPTPGPRKIIKPRQSPESLVRALKKGDWSDPLFNNAAQSVRLAQEAYEKGRITLGQYATVVIRWEALHDLKPPLQDRQPLPVLDREGKLAENAADLFGHPVPWMSFSDDDHGRYLGTRGLNHKELSRLEGLLHEIPASERNVWVMRTPDERQQKLFRMGKDTHWDRLKSSHGRLEGLLLAYIFKIPDRLKTSYSMLVVPSFGVLQALLQAKFPDTAVTLLPSFDPTTMPELMAGIGAGGRVLGLQHPDHETPEMADGTYFGKIIYTLHDYFHAYIGSTQSLGWRKIFHRVYSLGRDYREQTRKQGGPALRVREHDIPMLILDKEWENAESRLGDLALSNFAKPFLNPFEVLQKDFDYHSEGWPHAPVGLLAVVVRDIAQNPWFWSGAGFNVEEMVNSILRDSLFKHVYQEAKQDFL